MSIQRPTVEKLQKIAQDLHMELSYEQAAEYLANMQANFDAYDVIDDLADEVPEVKYKRDVGYRPTSEENPLNAWYYKSKVIGADSGKLAGRSVVLKDNIALAGVPMMNGSNTLEGFVPTYDATIVTRMLDAGATILGKATCEHFCLSGGSHSSDPGPVHNPHCYGYSAGGSSSGSAVLVANGEADLAIACDQGGSIRIPSSFCGVYGLKPTHGLVPYTGIMPIESTIDHVGPVSRNVRDNALLLEVLAGVDELDPRQYQVKVDDYTSYLDRGVQGLKIALVTEGFQLPNMDSRVEEKVRAAAAVFEKLGASVEEISLAEHQLAATLWTPIGCEGLTAQMMHGNGMGFNWKGQYDVALLDKHKNWRQQAEQLSPTLKVCMFIGQYGIEQYAGRYYAKAQNIARRACAAYDQKLAEYDLLLMPTLPIVAQPLPDQDSSITEYISRAFEMIGNTAALDITGHPAMTVPCGLVNGLPVGMMLVARHFSEGTIYQAAAAFESAIDWHDC